jgi:hypothetical protein
MAFCLSGVELIQISAFSASDFRINHGFTAEKVIGV